MVPLHSDLTILLKSISKMTGSDQGAKIVILLPQGATKIMSEKSDSLATGQENVPEQGGRLKGEGATFENPDPLGDDPKLCLTLTTVNSKSQICSVSSISSS